MVLAHPIVALLYERKMFHASDTAATAAALMFYAPGLLGYSAVKIVSPTFYSLRDARTPVIVSVISIGVNLGINLWLIRVMGYRGLALGTALAALFNAGVLLWFLRGRLGGLDGRRVAVALLKVLIASAVMGLAALVTLQWITGLTPAGGEMAKAARVLGSIGVAILALAAAARLLRIQEFNDAVATVRRRLSR